MGAEVGVSIAILRRRPMTNAVVEDRFQRVEVPARGGSFDGPGPAIAGGMMFVGSGYARAGGIPGNVLLAFSIDGK